MCAENAVVLVIHRNQSDPPNEEKILRPDKDILSGLHLGTSGKVLHLLQLSAYGSVNQTPELLSTSEVNSQNQEKLFHLLQEILQASLIAVAVAS